MHTLVVFRVEDKVEDVFRFVSHLFTGTWIGKLFILPCFVLVLLVLTVY
jgi:hypothetical protein